MSVASPAKVPCVAMVPPRFLVKLDTHLALTRERPSRADWLAAVLGAALELEQTTGKSAASLLRRVSEHEFDKRCMAHDEAAERRGAR